MQQPARALAFQVRVPGSGIQGYRVKRTIVAAGPRIPALRKIALPLQSILFKDGIQVTDTMPPQQLLAA